MRNAGEQEQTLLNEIGGEILDGSGFEDEIPDPSFEGDDLISPTGKQRRSEIRKERRHVE